MAEKLTVPVELTTNCPDPSGIINSALIETETQINAFCGICDNIPASVNAICGSGTKRCVVAGETMRGADGTIKPIAVGWTD